MEQAKRYKKAKIKKKKDSTVEIAAEVPVEVVAAYEDAVLAEVADGFELPGFRKGKVPMDIVRKNVNAMHVLEDAAREAVADAFREIAEDESLVTLGTPRISITKIAPGNPLEFAAAVSVMPEFDLPDYRTLAKSVGMAANAEVTDEEVDGTIRTIQAMRAANEGKKEEKLPELTDEYARSLGAFTDLADLRAKIRESITEEKMTEMKRKRREDIAAKLLEAVKIALPTLLVEEEMAEMEERRKAEIERLGTTLEEYLKQAGKKSVEELAAEERAYVERQMMTKFIFDRIAEAENIRPEDAEIERNRELLSARHPDADPERLVDYIRAMLVNEKVLRFLEENGEEKPAA